MSEMIAALQRALGDGYRVDRELGGGGMSQVFIAHDLTLDRDIVVKVLSDAASSGVSADRFRREIQVIAKLQHPHVVPILSAGDADGSLYYTMPFVTGETLRARLTREGALPIVDAVRLLREVLDALAFAHDHGIVHRDIKPENVLTSAQHAVVADFGIAKALHESGSMTSAGYAIGTPQYMAPEQATADPTTNHRADIYAVGVLGYELLTGAPPFQGSAQQVITAHLTTPAQTVLSKRGDVPPTLSDLIARALAKNPSDRPQSARDMIAALERVATPGATRSTMAAPTAAAPTVTMRYRWPLRLLALLMITSAGVYAYRVRTSAAPTSTVADGADVIAVMPLSAVSDTSLVRLGQDLVVTLSANLDGQGSLHTVDAMTLLMRVRKESSPLAIADARALAKDLGARSVITGTLINEGDNVRATIALSRVGSDSAIAKASAVTKSRDIATLTDSLTWSVLQQVWRQGTAPSPVLTVRTTKSFDALRAFLEGERSFQRLDIPAALVQYRRAFESDTNFAQAYLRFDYANEWNLRPAVATVHRRLLALKDSLPERDRLWVETRELRLPIPARIARWRELVKQYPDYPPILMAAADPIVHSGPIYGIPISEATPFLERIVQLVPDHADTKFHLGAVQMMTAHEADAAVSFHDAEKNMGAGLGPQVGAMGDLAASTIPAAPTASMPRLLAAARAMADDAKAGGGFTEFIGMIGFFPFNPPVQLAALVTARAQSVYTPDLLASSAIGEGELHIARGDWAGGLRALQRGESSTLTYGVRTTSARLAVIGAWLGTVDTATSGATLAHVQQFSMDGAGPVDRIEMQWLDGLQGVVSGDNARVMRARATLQRDTASAAHYAARSLNGLWMDHAKQPAAADTLKSISDDAMHSGGFLLSTEAVDRLVVARALRESKTPIAAERYLMWPDAAINNARSASVSAALTPLINFERGKAFERAGNIELALYHYRKFISVYDQPAPAQLALVDEAKQRIAKLQSTDDAPKTKSVPPR